MIISKDKMKISPDYTTEDWRKLDLTKVSDWEKAVEIFKDRIEGRFLKQIKELEKNKDDKIQEFSGFAILALNCLLIETLQQFKQGLPETKPRENKVAFVKFLAGSKVFKSDGFTKKRAGVFYKHFRCGILHQAEIKEDSLVKICQPELVGEYGNGLIVDRKKFHQCLIKEFETYLENLLENDRKHQVLRENFTRKMNFICRMIEPDLVKQLSDKIVYFAYGSNMSTSCFRQHIPSAKPIMRAYLEKKKMVCNKSSKDGSGKGNIVDNPTSKTWGVLFEIKQKELNKLDKKEDEGKGYRRVIINVKDDEGNLIAATTYIGIKVNDNLRAYDWYKERIIKGAEEHCLPTEYINYLKNIPSKT